MDDVFVIEGGSETDELVELSAVILRDEETVLDNKFVLEDST